MKKILTHILNSVVFWIIFIEILVAVGLYLFGFRITYAPCLENKWEAISAVAEWVGVIVGACIIPFAIVFLQHKWDEDKQDIALSNQETLNELTRFKEEFEPALKALLGGEAVLDCGNASTVSSSNRENIEDRILQYMKINMGATRSQIAEYFGISSAYTSQLIKKLLNDGKIQATGSARRRIYKVVNE